MEKTFKSIVIVVAIVFCVTMQAQNKSHKLENTLLWEITGNGLTKSSYLYGTIHMICGADYFLSEKAKKAFEASDKLVLEINLSDSNEIAEMQQLAIAKEPLDKKLTPSQLATLDEMSSWRISRKFNAVVSAFNVLSFTSIVMASTS